MFRIQIRTDPHKEMPPGSGSGSARTYADPDPDPGGKKACTMYRFIRWKQNWKNKSFFNVILKDLVKTILCNFSILVFTYLDPDPDLDPDPYGHDWDPGSGSGAAWKLMRIRNTEKNMEWRQQEAHATRAARAAWLASWSPSPGGGGHPRWSSWTDRIT